MNRTARTFIAAALTIAAGASFAQSSRNIPPSWANEEMKPFTSTVSREQVQAELAAARANGTVDQFDSLAYLKQDHLGNPVAVAVAKVREGASKVAATQTSGISREQVRAEVEAARASGELNPFDNLAYMNTSAPARVRTAPAAVAAK
jgi:hypothetical protein